MRVLVVDDEALLALDMAYILAGGGYEVVGPVGTVAGALELLAKSGCDAAIVDVNLGRETSALIATELSRCAIPFLALTGAARLPAEFKDAPIVTKPFSEPLLLAALANLFAAS